MCDVFGIYEVKDSPVWAQKIPYYVTYYPKIYYEKTDIDTIKISFFYNL